MISYKKWNPPANLGVYMKLSKFVLGISLILSGSLFAETKILLAKNSPKKATVGIELKLLSNKNVSLTYQDCSTSFQCEGTYKISEDSFIYTDLNCDNNKQLTLQFSITGQPLSFILNPEHVGYEVLADVKGNLYNSGVSDVGRFLLRQTETSRLSKEICK